VIVYRETKKNRKVPVPIVSFDESKKIVLKEDDCSATSINSEYTMSSQKMSTAASVGLGVAIGGVVAIAFMKWKESSTSTSKSFVEPPPVTFLESVPSE
jgi:hypothetical protein